MKVVGFSGWSGSGKTTLVEKLIARFRLAGLRVSVVKHAHHSFDIDHEGRDSWRHREAGAFEVVVASDRRLAKIREFEQPMDPTAHQLIAELYDCDWVFVEGFKHADLPKLEVWRPALGKPPQYPDDPFVAAVCSDDPARMPQPTALPVFHLDDADGVAAFLLDSAQRYEYRSPILEDGRPAADADAAAGAGASARRG